MALVAGTRLTRGGPRPDTALAAVEADVVVDGRVVDDRAVVDVRDVGVADVGYRAVVVELVTAPVAALVADASVSEAVINAAVEADVRAPVAGVPHVESVAPAPVPRGPEQAHFRREHPGARHPVVAFIVAAPGPVARHPDVARTRNCRLHVRREHRRGDVHRHTDEDRRG